MKTLKIALVVAILFGAVGVFAYDAVVKKDYEFSAIITGDRIATKIYVIDQENATCYIALTSGGNYAPNTGISCLAKEKAQSSYPLKK